jgi:probable addiction module antidote protein
MKGWQVRPEKVKKAGMTSMRAAQIWDTAEFLNSDEDIAAYLNAAITENEPALLNVALGNIARAKGMTQLARETGLTRDGLYKALSPDGNPSFTTVQKILKALNLRLNVAATF